MQFFSIIDPDIEKIRGKLICAIGGGGKSTLIHTLGRELVAHGFKVVLTSTTKLRKSDDMPLVLAKDNKTFRQEMSQALSGSPIAMVAEDYYKGDRLRGISRRFAQELLKYADVVLSECDGSRQRPLKTHKTYEPVIPGAANHVIIICGADIVGKELDDANVHRAELFAAKWQLAMGTKLSPAIIAGELVSPESYLRNVPLKSAISFYINRSDMNPEGGRLLAHRLAAISKHPVYLGSLKNRELQKVVLDSSAYQIH